LVEDSGKLRVSVTDQGIGFDPHQTSPDRFGLAGIRERARLFGGRASVRSRPGKGTCVTAEFPIADARIV
jgi:signal transduction histidine kinase